jgi:hypothetical protein
MFSREERMMGGRASSLAQTNGRGYCQKRQRGELLRPVVCLLALEIKIPQDSNSINKVRAYQIRLKSLSFRIQNNLKPLTGKIIYIHKIT